MKYFIDTSDKRIENYRSNNDYINQSFIKACYYGINLDEFESYKLYGKRHFVIGDIVDRIFSKILTFNEFHQTCLIVPDQIMNKYHIFLAVKNIIEDLNDIYLPTYSDTVYSILQYYKFGTKSWLKNTMLKKFYEQAVLYWNLLDKSYEFVLSETEYAKIERLCKLIDHSWVKRAVLPSKGWKVYYQYAVYFPYKLNNLTLSCKGLLDAVSIHKTKKIINLFDLKTTGKPVNKFHNSVISYNYFVQCYFYYAGIRHFYPDYEINFYFIVINEKDNYPVIYKMNENDLMIGKLGYDTLKVTGIDEMLSFCNEVSWQPQSIPLKILLNKGVLNMNFKND